MIPFEWIWDTSLSALLAAMILWASLEVAESNRWRDWLAYGLLWGLALMTNPALGALLPLLLVWAGVRRHPDKVGAGKSQRYNWRSGENGPDKSQHCNDDGKGWMRPAVALGMAVLCCVPWTMRNYVVFHRFIPLRSNFAFELYIGNNENYDEKYRHMPGPITKERETLRYFRMGEMAFLDEERHKAVRFIRTHPRMEMTLFADRFAAFWGGAPFPWKTFRTTDSWLVRVLILCAALSGVGALAGIVALLWRRSRYAFPLAVYPVVFPLVYYITHTSLRYRHPVEPAVVVLMAIACGAAWKVGPNRWLKKRAVTHS
jgi:hypothetical protein